MKKFLKIALFIVLAISLVFTFACNNDNGNGEEKGLILKKFKGDNYYTVVEYVAEENVSTLSIPAEKEGVAIGRIKAGAFDGNSSLKEITVSSSVQEIDAGAFRNMKSLEKITLPFVGNTVKADAYINQTPATEDKSVDAERSFAYIFGTEEYDDGVSVTCSYGASSGTYYIPCSLTEVTIVAENDYYIPMYAFYGLTQITTVNLQGKIVGIGEYAFAEFTSLRTVNIPNTIKYIYNNAFECCENLKTEGLKFADNTNLEYIGEKAFMNTALKTISLSVKVIDKYAFCELGLTSATITNAVEVKDYAFFGCENLDYTSLTTSLSGATVASTALIKDFSELSN